MTDWVSLVVALIAAAAAAVTAFATVRLERQTKKYVELTEKVVSQNADVVRQSVQPILEIRLRDGSSSPGELTYKFGVSNEGKGPAVHVAVRKVSTGRAVLSSKSVTPDETVIGTWTVEGEREVAPIRMEPAAQFGLELEYEDIYGNRYVAIHENGVTKNLRR